MCSRTGRSADHDTCSRNGPNARRCSAPTLTEAAGRLRGTDSAPASALLCRATGSRQGARDRGASHCPCQVKSLVGPGCGRASPRRGVRTRGARIRRDHRLAYGADSGPDGRQALVAANLSRLDVLGFERLEHELAQEAKDLGLDAALPSILEVTSQIGEFGRGERTSPSATDLIDGRPEPKDGHTLHASRGVRRLRAAHRPGGRQA